MQYAIGIDLGGTNIKTVAVTADGELLSQSSVSTDDADSAAIPNTREAWTGKIREVIDSIITERGAAPSWIGLSSPGLPARDGRSIAWMQGRMDAVQGLDWTNQLATPHVIPVVNDAQAALLGEAWQGAARGERDVVLLTLGTGVGGGILSDGRLLRGNIGRAGHLGHISLNPSGALGITGTPGSLEDSLGDCTLKARSSGRFESTRELVKAFEDGDEAATKIWMDMLRNLAAAIVSLANAVDPAVVIIGGGIAKAGPSLFEPLQKIVDEWEWRPTGTQVRIVAATLGEYAGAWGAAYNALNTDNQVQL